MGFYFVIFHTYVCIHNTKNYITLYVYYLQNITQVIARCCAQTCPNKKPVLVAAALKDTSKEMVNAICHQLSELQKP